MPTYVALLRGVNVSGHNGIAMKDLRALVEALPAEGVRTYLQSGNVVFQSLTEDAEALSRGLRDAIEAKTGLHVEVLVRTGREIDQVIDALPFGTEAQVHVTFLAAAPDAERAAALALHEAAVASPAADEDGDRDVFHLGDREIYLRCPQGYGRTKLNNALFERKLDVVATTRNWRTVTTLGDLARQ